MVFYARNYSNEDFWILIFKHDTELRVITNFHINHLAFNSMLEILFWLQTNKENENFILNNSRKFYSNLRPTDIRLN